MKVSMVTTWSFDAEILFECSWCLLSIVVSVRVKDEGVVLRECHGLPWGFPRQPVPVPVKTRTHYQGYGFLRVWVKGFDG